MNGHSTRPPANASPTASASPRQVPGSRQRSRSQHKTGSVRCQNTSAYRYHICRQGSSSAASAPPLSAKFSRSTAARNTNMMTCPTRYSHSCCVTSLRGLNRATSPLQVQNSAM